MRRPDSASEKYRSQSSATVVALRLLLYFFIVGISTCGHVAEQSPRLFSADLGSWGAVSADGVKALPPFTRPVHQHIGDGGPAL